MKKIILIFFVLFLLFKVNAQNQVSGIITDTDNNPLPGASVFLPEISKGTMTDSQGKFQFKNIPNGEIKIQISFLGYNTQILSVNLPSQQTFLTIQLTVAVIQSQEIVVTGGYVSSQHKNAVKIDLINNSKIKLSGTPNIMEALTSIPGIDMISKGAGISKPVIRGLSMNDILVLNNGVRLENYQYSENHPLGIDGNNIDRVEIIKGPASLLYGSDAIGGVINFIKAKPAPQGKIIGSYSGQLYSNTIGMNHTLELKAASQKFFGGVSIGMKTHSDYLQGGGNYVPNSRFNENTLNTNAAYTSKIGTFKLYFDYFKQDLGMSVPNSIPLINEPGRKNEIWYQNLEHITLSSQNNIYIKNIKWETNFALQSALRKLETTLDFPVIEMNLQTLTYESKLHLPSNNNSEYIIGLQGMNQKNTNLNNRISQFLPDAQINNIGFLALVQYTFFKKLMAQGGIRYDINKTETYALGIEESPTFQAPVNKDFSNFNGSVGATYSQNEKLMFRFNFAKAYRAPNLSELTSMGMHGNRFEAGNENLKPQNAYESDLSMHYHGEYLSLDLAGFYNNISNFIYISPTNDTTQSGLSIYKFAQTDARLYGGEAGIHFHPKVAKWLHYEITYSMVTGIRQNGEYLPYIPAGKIRNEIRAEYKKISVFYKPKIKLSSITALKQDNPSVFETQTSGYTIFALGFDTRLKAYKQDVIIGFYINNLFDTKYFDHLSTLKPLNYYNQGRNISLYVKIPFSIKN